MDGENVIEFTGELNSRSGEKDDVIADGHEIGYGVRGQQHRRSVFFDRFQEYLHEILASERVKRRDGLVEKKQLRSLGQTHGECDLRLLPAGQFPNSRGERYTKLFEVTTCSHVVPTRVELAPEAENFLHAEVLVKRAILVEVGHASERFNALGPRRLAEHVDRAGTRSADPSEHAKERRLSGAVWSDESRHPALGKSKGTVLEAPRSSVALAESDRFYCGYWRGHGVPFSFTMVFCCRASVTSAMLAFSIQAARSLCSSASRFGVVGGVPPSTMNVPRPWRPSTRPSASRSRYARWTVLGLIVICLITSRTEGSWSPALSRPRLTICRTWSTS